MKIDIYSDVVCPWCWIGKRRFNQALELLGDAAPALELHWQPFLLDPDAGTEPVPLRQAYARKFGGAERTEQLLAQTQATAQGEGLPMDFSQGQVRVTTLPAHRLMWLAGQHGVQDAVGEALFAAHFQHGRNLAEREVLLQAAAEGGLPADAVNAMFDSSQGLQEVNAALERARVLGISSVPTFVIDGRWAIQGAQAPEEIAAVLQRIAAQQAPPGDDGADRAADDCGADGCRV